MLADEVNEGETETGKKRWPATEVEMVAVASLIPYARNPRRHSDEQVRQIAASITEWGWTVPVLVDESNNVIAGHGRALAAQLLKLESVPAMRATGWSEAQKRAYVIADNRLSENATWDDDLLRVELADLVELGFDATLTGFDARALAGVLNPDDLSSEDSPAPERPADPVTRLGDLWSLGNHRLLCGDSTKFADVARLLDGQVPFLMVTDPPYGVEYDPAWRNEVRTPSPRVGKVANDDRVDWTAAWQLFPGSVAYVWHAGRHSAEVAESLRRSGFEVRSQVIWSKSRFALSRGNYHWQHEPCWYGVKPGDKLSLEERHAIADKIVDSYLRNEYADTQHDPCWYALRPKSTARWIGDRKQTTLWEISPVGEENHDAWNAKAARVYGAPDPQSRCAECL